MIAAILLSTVAFVLVLLSVLAGVDTRDGRDWQPRADWTARRGSPHN